MMLLKERRFNDLMGTMAPISNRVENEAALKIQTRARVFLAKKILQMKK